MSPRNSGCEISLRHLPDVSDSSFSFQIPGPTQEDNLLADDGLDFFQAANLSAGPPNSPPSNPNAPLTLSQVTPRPASQNRAPPNSTSPPSFPITSTRSADDKMPDLKQQKPMSRTQRPKLSKLDTEVMCQPKPRSFMPVIPHLPPAEGSSAGARLEALRAQLDSLSEDLHIRSSVGRQELVEAESRRPKDIERPSLEKIHPHAPVEKREKQIRTRQKITEGGIAKVKHIFKPKEKDKPASAFRTTSSTTAKDLFSQQSQSDISKDLHGDEHVLDDTSISSLGDDGAAARLVQYSQKLITSFGQLESDSVNAASAPGQSQAQQLNFHQGPETGTDMNPAQLETLDHDGPLTVSQLSPRKTGRPPTPTPPANQPMSPLRPSNKRPVSVADEGRERKKSKIDASDASDGSSTIVRRPDASTDSMPLRSTSRCQPRLNVSDSATAGLSARDRTKSRAKATVRAPVIKIGQKDENEGARQPSRSAAGSNPTSSTSNQRTSSRYDTIEPGKQASSLKGKNKAVAPSSSFSKTVFHAPLRATRPAEFKLHQDSRLEARMRQGNPENESTSSHSRSRSQREKRPIPDFKAMHAALEAELALRKENIHPTVPLPIKWETDERLKERHKFDEIMREKEREHARLIEEKKKEQEAQEERELRELRKKTIPKANEVPEWYKEAPKKKEKTISGVGRREGVRQS